MSSHRSRGLDGAGEDPTVGDAEPADVEELVGDLESLAAAMDSPEAAEAVDETVALLAAAHERGIIESRVRGLDARDAAEALVGSVIFASPLLVEDGVFDIADHLFGVTVSAVPVFLVANTVFVVFMAYALLEWTGRDREEVSRLVGGVPTRVVMVLIVAFAVATVLMTVWGRVDWASPVEAVARINVLWTVGTIGAALGDILADGGSPSSEIAVDDGPAQAATGWDAAADESGGDSMEPADLDPARHHSDGVLIAALYEQFDDLEDLLDGHDERSEVRRLRARTGGAAVDRPFGDQILKYTTRDLAEAFVGSVVFAIPFLVEDGVFDVADYFLAFRVGAFPVFFIANAAFVVLMIGALVYWAGPREVQVSRPLFGIVPRRLVGISVVSFLAAAALMTMWGRVDGWADPVVAVARISAVWTVASFGAALGDVLPGESSGDDINDDLAELGDRVGR